MGGTTAKACLSQDGELPVTTETECVLCFLVMQAPPDSSSVDGKSRLATCPVFAYTTNCGKPHAHLGDSILGRFRRRG